MIVIAGGGLAGMVAAYELLDRNQRVLLIDKDRRENFGGLAKESVRRRAHDRHTGSESRIRRNEYCTSASSSINSNRLIKLSE